jgi:exopolyphosphatase/guanosine-5'-triphosphate,3'-diphosphate pyrophosphatase
VATAALRDAANGAKLATRISREIGTPVRLLSGEEEARLIFKAFQRRLALGSEPVLGLDLGGGSLEMALGDAREIEWESTLPLGAVRLRSAFVRNDPMRKSELRALRQKVRVSLKPARDALSGARLTKAIAAGGTVRALARLVVGATASEIEPPLEISADELEALCEKLVLSNHHERLRTPGVRRRRADLLPTAAVILTTVADVLGLEGFTISDWGLREGVLLSELTGTS